MNSLVSLKPLTWDVPEVIEWLEANDIPAGVQSLFREHAIDGLALLLIEENDLRQQPLAISYLGDAKRLWLALSQLKRQFVTQIVTATRKTQLHDIESRLRVLFPLEHAEASSSRICTVLHLIGTQQPSLLSSSSAHAFNSRLMPRVASSPAIRRRETQDMTSTTSGDEERDPTRSVRKLQRRMPGLMKTIVAGMYCSAVLLIASAVMVHVHDSVPDMHKYPPLPDLFLDNVPLIPWAFEMCELLAIVSFVFLVLILVFHRYRLIILRRIFSLVGTVFLLRCFTMVITSLSVPGVHLACEPQRFVTFDAKVRQAFHIWLNAGMSVRGAHTCGDYMFSGHTAAVTLLNHFITEYSPASWHYLHTLSWVMNLFGVFFILAGHEHYSIDVFIAFYISSRLFLYYHSMAYSARAFAKRDRRTIMWFPLLWFFESGGEFGRVPNEYESPLAALLDALHWRSERAAMRDAAKGGGSGVPPMSSPPASSPGGASNKSPVQSDTSTHAKTRPTRRRAKKDRKS